MAKSNSKLALPSWQVAYRRLHGKRDPRLAIAVRIRLLRAAHGFDLVENEAHRIGDERGMSLATVYRFHRAGMWLMKYAPRTILRPLVAAVA
ncbi:MAG: hypothetical protein HYZ75_00820 [Elusimicrobia bacterium]|nr:hypothetical protein [Elusimicrobiota bacterium]